MKRYKINKGFIVEKLDNKITIFDSEKSLLYTFNDTASFIFKKIKKNMSEKEIIKVLMEKYGLHKNKAEKDTKKLIRNLLCKKIISL